MRVFTHSLDELPSKISFCLPSLKLNDEDIFQSLVEVITFYRNINSNFTSKVKQSLGQVNFQSIMSILIFLSVSYL